jgi:DNA-binding MarR family transcriptional regulator
MKSRFARIPEWAIGCRELSASDWRVYACISLHTNHNGSGAYPGMTKIAAMTGIRRGDVPRSLRRLEQHGLIRRERRAGGKAWESNRYIVVFDTDAVSADLRTGVSEIADTVSADLRTGVSEIADTMSADLREGCPQIRTGGVRNGADQTDLTDNRTVSARSARARAEHANGASDRFEQFWCAYPSRQPHSNPKKPARLKFEALVKKGFDPFTIIRGAENYRAAIEQTRTEPRYIKQAVTFLNQEAFADYQQQPAAPRHLYGMI